jgi:hypothetical protein
LRIEAFEFQRQRRRCTDHHAEHDCLLPQGSHGLLQVW